MRSLSISKTVAVRRWQVVLQSIFIIPPSGNPFGVTDAFGEISATLPVTPAQLKITYKGITNYIKEDVDIADGTVAFQTIDVKVTLKTGESAGHEGGVIDYYAGNDWRPFGSTDINGEAHLEMLPSSPDFRVEYAYAQNWIYDHDTGVTPVVNFLTTAVTMGWPDTIEYLRNSWRPFIKPTMEMLPGTYKFKFTSSSPGIYEDLVIEGCEFSFPAVDNTPPVADAGGPYLVAVDQTIILDGSGSYDDDGDFLTYLWTQDEALGTFYYPDSESPDFTGGQAGMTILTLTVSDGQADDSATAILVVYDPSGGFVTGGEPER